MWFNLTKRQLGLAMTHDSFERALRAFQQRTPFRPFSVEFVSGERIAIDHPEALIVRAGVAVFISSKGVPTLFDHESVSELIGEVTEVK